MKKNLDYQKIEKTANAKKTVRNVIVYTFLTLWAVMVLFPFYWMILSSIKSYSAYNAEFIPKLYTLAPTFENYVEAFTAVPLMKYLLNTVIFTVGTTALMLIVCFMYSPMIKKVLFKVQKNLLNHNLKIVKKNFN